MYCRQHAEDDIVNACKEDWAQKCCSKQPNFRMKGSKVRVYCKRHAKDDMDIVNERCSQECCRIRPTIGFAGEAVASVCEEHVGIPSHGLVNNMETRRNTARYRLAICGVNDSIPEHCSKYRNIINSCLDNCGVEDRICPSILDDSREDDRIVRATTVKSNGADQPPLVPPRANIEEIISTESGDNQAIPTQD